MDTTDQVTVELAWRHFYQNHSLDVKMPNAELVAILPQTIRSLVLQMTDMVAGERVEEISYPLNWWEAVRERWFPKFWLRIYPVRYFRWKIDYLYREVKPGATVAVYHNRGSRGYPHFEDQKSIYWTRKRNWVPQWLYELVNKPEDK